ncbi:MAG: ParA family protein [Deltaproteobacteria bacterium]|nr:ParA family protein [Deltaproteobacteria bacterium]
MGRIITVASHKGGVGKTTTTLNLGFSLARAGGRTLVVDADPQGGLGAASNVRSRTPLGVTDVLAGRASLEDAIARSRSGNLSVIGMGAATAEDVRCVEDAAADGRLADLLRSLAPAWDHVLVDAPAGVGGLVRALLDGSDGVLLVLHCRPIAVRTLPAFLRLLKDQAQAGDAPRLEGVLVTMMNHASAVDVGLLQELRARLPAGTLFHTVVPQDPRFESASAQAIPVALSAEAASLARYYLELAIELEQRNRQAAGGVDDDAASASLF